MAITEALESLDFSGSAYKIPGQVSDWSSLDRVHMPKPIRMTREMVHCDWPGLDYCFSLRGVVGEYIMDSPTRTTWREGQTPQR